MRPQPWAIVRRGRAVDEEGRERDVRRPSTVAGVDGLKAGKRYKATVALEKLEKAPWWWGGVDDEERSENGNENEELLIPLVFVVEGEGVEFAVEE